MTNIWTALPTPKLLTFLPFTRLFWNVVLNSVQFFHELTEKQSANQTFVEEFSTNVQDWHSKCFLIFTIYSGHNFWILDAIWTLVFTAWSIWLKITFLFYSKSSWTFPPLLICLRLQHSNCFSHICWTEYQQFILVNNAASLSFPLNFAFLQGWC